MQRCVLCVTLARRAQSIPPRRNVSRAVIAVEHEPHWYARLVHRCRQRCGNVLLVQRLVGTRDRRPTLHSDGGRGLSHCLQPCLAGSTARTQSALTASTSQHSDVSSSTHRQRVRPSSTHRSLRPTRRTSSRLAAHAKQNGLRTRSAVAAALPHRVVVERTWDGGVLEQATAMISAPRCNGGHQKSVHIQPTRPPLEHVSHPKLV